MTKKDLEVHFSIPSEVPKGATKETAVLALLEETEEGLCFLLTKRTQLVETHKGQISFPGGYWEERDEHLLETALRETEEETGIPRSHVKVLGVLPKVKTRRDIWITPWVAVREQKGNLLLQAREVEKVLHLPISRLFEEGLKLHKINMQTFSIVSPGIFFDGELVWGATARILQHFLDHIRDR